MVSTSPPASLEAKLVILGSQGVGKTSLVERFVKNAFIPPEKAQSTLGASFLTTRVHDPESGTTIRLQIWDTAGQERFRSISRLYYRGANAAILAYDVTSRKSFDDMGVWLKELKDVCGGDIVIHVVGTKTDMVAAEPQTREVPFERCIGYVAEQLHPDIVTPGPRVAVSSSSVGSTGTALQTWPSPVSHRTSSCAQDTIFDFCHEVSAKDGEGIDEVFRVITRKLVEQHNKKVEHLKTLESMQSRGGISGTNEVGNAEGYFDIPKRNAGSFRVGYGDKRRSWLGIPSTPGGWTGSGDGNVDAEVSKGLKKGRCC